MPTKRAGYKRAVFSIRCVDSKRAEPSIKLVIRCVGSRRAEPSIRLAGLQRRFDCRKS